MPTGVWFQLFTSGRRYVQMMLLYTNNATAPARSFFLENCKTWLQKLDCLLVVIRWMATGRFSLAWFFWWAHNHRVFLHVELTNTAITLWACTPLSLLQVSKAAIPSIRTTVKCQVAMRFTGCQPLAWGIAKQLKIRIWPRISSEVSVARRF